MADALAAGLLGDEAFYVVNGDAFWLDGPIPALTRWADSMAIEDADAVLLLHADACMSPARRGRAISLSMTGASAPPGGE